MPAPNPATAFPLEGYDRLCFLKNVVTNPLIEVGDFTYYDDFKSVENFERNVRYLFDFTGDRLVIGKFCMIASDVTFIMNGANHLSEAVSAYPFAIFGGDWAGAMEGKAYPSKGDTRVGNDVWLGYGATIMPGVTIGDGAIVATKSVVANDVEPYTIVGGNPARVIRKRFMPHEIDQLLKLSWWNWPLDRITKHLHLLTSGDVSTLLTAAANEDELP